MKRKKIRSLWTRAFVGILVFSATTAMAGKPEEVKFPSGKLLLHGFIQKPDGAGPFPAVLYNHGSEKLPGSKPELAELFTDKGYVFFVPHRRGQGRSPGKYIEDLLALETRANRSSQLVELQEEHQEDVIAALAFLKTLPYVDLNKIVIAGCSYGGIQTVLATERKLEIRAAIAFAPAAQSWQGSYHLRERLLRAVRQATVPVLLIQAENDYDLSPTQALDEEMKKAGKLHRRVVFPPYGKSAQEGHGGFCFGGGRVWGDEVFSFLDAIMQR